MNTADRSLVGLDLALRRRFSFEELEPKPELLKGKVTGVDLVQFLNTLNERIEQHLDRDHRIGHAFLMGPTDMEGLARAMRKKVIPQLMEYFHDRPDLLAKVLEGTGFVEFDNSSTPPRVKRIASEELSVAGNYSALMSAS
jgi:5-methylcytosine-specific restriction protein B